MERKLELKDICGYLPHGLIVVKNRNKYPASTIIKNELRSGELSLDENYMPIIRPLSDLYKTITHNGKEIVPIVELAKISLNFKCWHFNENENGDFKYAEFNSEYGYIKFWYSDEEDCFKCDKKDVLNQYQLFDYLNELKIDYRGLIDLGLAVSVYDLEENPYK